MALISVMVALPTCQTPHDFFSAFPIHAQTHQCAISVDYSPAACLPVAFYPHRVCSPRRGGRAGVLPLGGATCLCTSRQPSCGITRSGRLCDSASSGRRASDTSPLPLVPACLASALLRPLPWRLVYRPVCGGEHLPALLPIRPLPAAAYGTGPAWGLTLSPRTSID